MNHDSACGTGSVEGRGTEAVKGLTSEIAMGRSPKIALSNGNGRSNISSGRSNVAALLIHYELEK